MSVEFKSGFSIKHIRNWSDLLIFKVTKNTAFNKYDSILSNYQVVITSKRFEILQRDRLLVELLGCVEKYGRVVDFNATNYPEKVVVTFNNFGSASKLQERGYLDLNLTGLDIIPMLCDKPKKQVLVRNIARDSVGFRERYGF